MSDDEEFELTSENDHTQRRVIGVKPLPKVSDELENEFGLVDLGRSDLAKIETELRKIRRDPNVYNRKADPNRNAKRDTVVVLRRYDGTEVEVVSRTTFKKAWTKANQLGVGAPQPGNIQYVVVRSEGEEHLLNVSHRQNEMSNIEDLLFGDAPHDTLEEFMTGEILSEEKSMKNNMLEQSKPNFRENIPDQEAQVTNILQQKIIEAEQALAHLKSLAEVRKEFDAELADKNLTPYDVFPEWRRVDESHTELRAKFKQEAEAKGVSVEDVFSEYADGSIKVKSEVVKESRKGKSSGNAKPYDPNDHTTFKTPHWNNLGLKFSKGAKYKLPDGTIFVYESPKGKNETALSALRVELWKAGEKKLPLVEEADKSAE